MKNTRLYLILLALMVLTPMAWAQGLSGSGTSADPYLISSSADWNTFAQSVTGGTTYAGQFVKLTADITASVMAGSHTSESTYHAFSGTFDGDGHTITLNLSGSGEGLALFSDIEGATLKNLKAQGTVATTDRRPATFAVFVAGTCNINNCWSTVAVSSTRASGWVDGGGFVARVRANDTLNMTGCAFHGSVTFTNGATTGGGMVGYTQDRATVNLTNCLYSPTSLTLNVYDYNPRVFVSGYVAGNLTNCYYNAVAAASVLGKQGTDASDMTNEALADALGEGWHVYNGMVVPFLGEYYISSAAEWNAFATAVNNGKSYNGQIVTLTTDIPTAEEIANNTTAVTTMAGTESHPFCGTFDGDGHTITLALSGSGEGIALFSDIEGATLKNLKAQGTVTTTDRRPATFAIFVAGTCNINNCWSTVAVSSTRASGWVDGGGFVGRVSSSATLNMTGCAFHGSVTFTNGATTGGGMVGYTQDSATVNLTNCLYSPTALALNVSQYSPRIFVSGNVAGNLNNCYYNAVAAASVLGKQGKLMHSITAGEYVTVAFSDQPTVTYSVSGFSAYSPGIVYDSTLYAGQGDTVSLNLGCTPPQGYTFNGFSADAGTLNGTANPYTLTMPNEDVTLQAVLESLSSVNYIDGDGVVHTCNNFTILTGEETTLMGGWYVVEDDITYNHPLTLIGDVNLILCNGKTMTVTAESGSGIVGDTLTIYGQSLDSIAAGTLNVTNNDCQFAAIHPSNYIQHSGNVVASNLDGEALYANYITMNGGNITASGSSFGIKADFDMNLNGGTIIVNNNNTAQAPTNLVVTPAANNVLSATVSWTNPSKTLNNSNLTNIDQIVVCRNNEIIYTEDNVTPGANMTITDDRVPRFDAFQYSVYAVCNGAHGKIIYLDNIAFGPTCGWTINVTQASFQGFRGGKIHVYNAAGTDIAQITTTNSTAQTIPVDMPVGRVSFGWSAPTQSGSFTMAFTIMDSQNNTVYTYSGSSDQLAEGIFCETNNGCGNSAGDGVPTNVVALVDEENPNNIIVSWNPIRPDGYGYTVYRDGMLYRLIPNATSFVDENASLGGHCYVVGFLGYGGENGLYSNESCASFGACYPATDFDFEYTGNNYKIKLKWEKPEPHDGLTGYYLYRKFGEDDEYVRIKLLGANATSYIDNSANHEGNYYYKLYAYYGDLNCTSAPAYWIHDHNQFYLLAPYSSNGVYEMECQGESVDINDGTIIANYNRNQGNSYSGLSINGNLVINGGKVEAFSIWAQNDITLGWTNTDDYILSGNYSVEEGTVIVKTGQAFYYGNNVIVNGTLDEDQINAIGGKTLRPYIVPTTVTKDIAGYGTGDGSWQLIALPLQGAFHPTSINNMVADTAAHYDLYRFEPSHKDNEWENYKASNTFKLETGKGYLYANTDDVTLTFSGPSYIGDSCEIALVYDSTDYQKCWNLVGNPFNCNATLDREYYVLDENGLDINPEPIPATTPIPPCTAVFVKAVAEGDKAVFTKVTQ